MTREEAAEVLSMLLIYGTQANSLSKHQRDAIAIAVEWTMPGKESHGAESLPDLLMEMVKKDSKAAAEWMHEFADTIDKLNEATDRLMMDENGLAPCGCGGKAILRKDVTRGEKQEDIWYIKCQDCGISTAECFRELFARNDWNNAMGRNV